MEHERVGIIPDKILVLPAVTETGDLEDEDTIVVEKVVNLAQERIIPTDTNMLKRKESFSFESPASLNMMKRRTSAISKLTILVYVAGPPGISL